MAKQDGILQIRGTIDTLTFYKSDAGFLVKRKSSVSKQKVAKGAAYVRTRENNQEFGDCVLAAKRLRSAVSLLVLKAKDRRLSNRLFSVFAQIKKLDGTSVRGQRTVAKGLVPAGGKLLLKGFDFNARSPLSSILSAPLDLDVATGAVGIANLLSVEQLQLPDGATHYTLQSAYAKLDFETGLFEVCYSPALTAVLDMTAQQPTLTPVAVPSGLGVSLYFILIAFSQEVNGVRYPLHNGAHNVLHLLDVL